MLQRTLPGNYYRYPLTWRSPGISSKLSEERAARHEILPWGNEEMTIKVPADQIQFIQKPIIDDWNGFKTALSTYEDISADDKASI